MNTWGQLQLWQGDCLQLMKDLGDGSIDLIIADLPYGITDCHWDHKLDLVNFWVECNRVITQRGCIALTSVQPFTTDLIISNRSMFRYSWVWNKSKGGNMMSCAYQPYKVHEEILIFSKSGANRNNTGECMNYYPIMEKMDKKRVGKNYNKSEAFGSSKLRKGYSKEYSEKYPKSIINISNAKQGGKIHPTQKPVGLMEYLITTYTVPGMKVLDPCCGSGVVLEACYKLGRAGIGIEIEDKYCHLIRQRMDALTSASGC